ncbi:hypothetical protein [Solibacillus sp. FSL H8-0538]|uniref:hypothetical protein n=1 Tax=Solibacillus sp. FSL H8-0538 TaxID=2921400 RepID=UPI0030FD11C7
MVRLPDYSVSTQGTHYNIWANESKKAIQIIPNDARYAKVLAALAQKLGAILDEAQ